MIARAVVVSLFIAAACTPDADPASPLSLM